jgi:hypothetical protein
VPTINWSLRQFIAVQPPQTNGTGIAEWSITFNFS